MTRIYLLLFVLLCNINTYAQTASRVIAFAWYGTDTTIAPVDSGGYKYSHGNGGGIQWDLDEEFEEDFPFVYEATYDFETGHRGLVKSDSSWETGPGDTDISVQFFDENSNITYSLCDKFSNGIWAKYSSKSFAYDTGNKLMQEIDTNFAQGNWGNIKLQSYTYDENNRIIQETITYEVWPDTNWFSSGKNIFQYDDVGNLLTNRYYEWLAKTNLYNGPDSSIVSFAYTNNRPDSFVLSSVYPPNRIIGRYSFSTDNDTMVVHHEYITTTNVYDGQHNKTSLTQFISDSDAFYSAPYRYEYSYNAYNQVTCQRGYYLDTASNAWVFSNLIKYYYENYTPEVTFNINTISIFPSPARGSITVKLEWPKAAAFNCAIFDAAGHRVMQWSVPATQKYEQTVSLPFLASGNYLLRAATSGQKMVKQFVLIN